MHGWETRTRALDFLRHFCSYTVLFTLFANSWQASASSRLVCGSKPCRRSCDGARFLVSYGRPVVGKNEDKALGESLRHQETGYGHERPVLSLNAVRTRAG
ncbi:hypothetical protein PISMIDRAFT_326159 [Pisolithus microcarpus 441]|uniref:Uncharacterized protein n=1 Tax=Pisolithus microcarpus 441 TaxID=765257 RepID=A0A0C9ZU98_9AGAM|nr:hypothetical protein BKA83DRAFT_326159 [Pisolithus microcarpus]KIK25842.1 hypothetical protein PISMIDRAFT_326159 [Pisolithus microcarpus 441]